MFSYIDVSDIEIDDNAYNCTVQATIKRFDDGIGHTQFGYHSDIYYAIDEYKLIDVTTYIDDVETEITPNTTLMNQLRRYVDQHIIPKYEYE